MSTSDLTTLEGLSGEDLRIKNWVIRAWDEIQSRHPDWKWMRGTYSFVTTANDGAYSSSDAGIASRFGGWDKTYCTVYTTSAGVADQVELGYLDYETFRSYYLTRSQSPSVPRHFSVGLSNELLLGHAPDSNLYTVTGQYSKSPQTLSANGDIPELPEQHEVIAYLAMMKYGRFEGAQEILSAASNEYRRIMNDLRNKYLPEIQLGCPLV